jgi:hypothetical protein
VLLGAAKPNGNKEKLLTKELANRVQYCAEDGPKIKCMHTLKWNRMSKNLPRSRRTKQKTIDFGMADLIQWKENLYAENKIGSA